MGKPDKQGWDIERGGLHRRYVDGRLVGWVERGREQDLWYWVADVCGERTSGLPTETATEARDKVEKALEIE